MQVDDKYQYSMDNKDGGVHGWISSGPIIGFWIIFPSNEFRNGGPTKQNLTVHTGPACLAVNFSL
jgi:rhamnogalacturonan endolyase